MDPGEVRRQSSASSSPEFEFWPLHPNPAASPSCADELFAGGVLLPLPVLPPKPSSSSSSHRNTSGGGGQGVPASEPEAEPAEASSSILLATVAPPTASITSPPPPSTGGSKRWTDIFSKKPTPAEAEKDKETKEKRKDGRKQAAAHAGGGGGSELNINIWPFSRSRSAGGGGGASVSSKPRAPARKVSSAPCSRSNSRGEAAAGAPTRRWAASPGRAGGGVPVGRSSPVWQIRRPATRAPSPATREQAFTADRRAAAAQAHKEKSSSSAATGRKGAGLGGGVRGLNLSVNSCIGYRHQVSCRRADVGGGRGHGGGGLFGIKGFFSKKVVH
ncbi:hypothetical protein HU200_038471 [Digitaria exilis]|uniref:Uncharacterized protein n=1 Tax=Digitaria exilis TaxID=1010633 RepID=A0A835BNS7_9POAL|nr:hypothetical protein HU200_038471 [Digitaria exilis]